jgi:CRP-like cAMP-binding protein
LPAAEYQRLAPHLTRVQLKAGEVIYLPNRPIRHAYFPESAVLSQLATLQDGSTAGVGVVGREGMLGIRLLYGAETAPHQAVVLAAGGAVRARAGLLEEAARPGGPLHDLLHGFAQALLVQVRQSVVCNAHHSLSRRAARLLLMTSARTGSDELRVTQEAIAHLVGTRRAGVNEAIGKFRRSGLVGQRRGRIMILDRRGLEGAACECYRIVKQEYERLLGAEALWG